MYLPYLLTNIKKITWVLISFFVFIPNAKASPVDFADNLPSEQNTLINFSFPGNNDYPKGKYTVIFTCLNGVNEPTTQSVTNSVIPLIKKSISIETHQEPKIFKTSREYGQTCAYAYARSHDIMQNDDEMDELSHELLETKNSFFVSSSGKSKNRFRNISKGTPRENAIKDAMINAVNSALISIKPSGLLPNTENTNFRKLATNVFSSAKKGLINKYKITSEYSKKNYYYTEIDVTIDIKKLKRTVRSLKRRSKSPVFYIDKSIKDNNMFIKKALKSLKIETADSDLDAQIIISQEKPPGNNLPTFSISEPGQDALYTWTPRFESQLSQKKFKRLFTTSLLLISSKGGTLYNIQIDRHTSPGLSLLESGIKKIRGIQLQSITTFPHMTEIIIRSNLQRHKVSSRIMQYLSNYTDSFELLLLRNKILQFKKPTSELSYQPTLASTIIHNELKLDSSAFLTNLELSPFFIDNKVTQHPNGQKFNFKYYGSNVDFLSELETLISPLTNLPAKFHIKSNFEIHASLTNTAISDIKSYEDRFYEYLDRVEFFLIKFYKISIEWIDNMVNMAQSKINSLL